MDIEKERTHIHKSGWVRRRVLYFLKGPFFVLFKHLSTFSLFHIYHGSNNGKAFGAHVLFIVT